MLLDEIYKHRVFTEADNVGDEQPAADNNDDYEIQDNETEQPNVDNSGGNNTEDDNQNTGDNQDDDYEIQDDDNDNQDDATQNDDQNTSENQDDGGNDDYEIQDDDEDNGSDNAETSSENDSDSNADTSGGEDINSDDPRAKLNALEKSIFDQLSPDQQKAKTAELKNLYQIAFNNCQKIIDTISNTESNPSTVKVFDYIVSRLTDLKGYITDYLKDVFDNRGYLENMTEFQKYLAVFDTIKNTFNDIQKENEK